MELVTYCRTAALAFSENSLGRNSLNRNDRSICYGSGDVRKNNLCATYSEKWEFDTKKMRCTEKGSLDTDVNQGFVFLSVLEKIENRLHVCLLQEQNIWIYGKDKKKNNNFRWITKCQINRCTAERCRYIWHWSGYALDPWSCPSPHRYEEEKALVEETLATVCYADCRCKTPSAPVLGSPFLGKSSLSWRKICKTHESFIDRDITMFDPWKRWCHLLFQNGHKRFQNCVEDIYEEGVSCKGNKSVSVILE